MNRFSLLFISIVLVALISCTQKRASFFSYVDGATGITGAVTRNGTLIEGVDVYLYRNAKSNFRGPADFVDVTDENGRYFIDVPEGKYYIIARKRKSGLKSGPLRANDLYSEPIYDPVIVAKGKSAKVDLVLRQLFGALIQKSSGQKKTSTYIRGVIVDVSGSPLKGVYAFAYSNEDFKREPDFFSSETGTDGTFTLYLEEGAKYFLGAKDSGRGIPKPGDLYSFYDGPRGSGMLIKTDEKILDIRITLKKYK